MDIQQVNHFIFTNQDKFKASHIPVVKSILEQLNGHSLAEVKLINPIAILVASMFLGFLGIDRFLLKNIKSGILKVSIFLSSNILILVSAFQYKDDTAYFLTPYLFVILTTSGFLFWLCDIFTSIGRSKTYNLLQLRNLAIRLGIMTPLTATPYIQKPLFRQNISDAPDRYNTSYNNYQTETSNNYNTKTPDYSHYQRKPTPYDKSDD